MTFKTVLTERGYEVGVYNAKTGIIELDNDGPVFQRIGGAKRHAKRMQDFEKCWDSFMYSHACGYHD